MTSPAIDVLQRELHLLRVDIRTDKKLQERHSRDLDAVNQRLVRTIAAAQSIEGAIEVLGGEVLDS